MAKAKQAAADAPAAQPANKSISVELKRGRIGADSEEGKLIREMKQKGKSFEEIGAQCQRSAQTIENFLSGNTAAAKKRSTKNAEPADPLDSIPADERDDYIAFKLAKIRAEHKINIKDPAHGEEAIRLLRKATEAKKIYEDLMSKLHAL